MGQAGISDPKTDVADPQTGAVAPQTVDAARQTGAALEETGDADDGTDATNQRTGDAAAQSAGARLQPEASEGASGTTENPTGPKTSDFLRLWPWKATGLPETGRREMQADPDFYAKLPSTPSAPAFA